MDSSVQRVADMDWDLVMHYVAGGARWRRVPEAQRPSIEVRVEFFEPQISHWTELERLSFWADVERDSIFSEAGALNVRYKPGAGEKELGSFLKDHIWRVAKRDGRLFTVELAAFADGRDVLKELAGIAVTPDGDDGAELEPDKDFWRKNAQLYLVENIPFGVVRVAVPRNVAEPVAAARRKVKALLGLDAVEHVAVWDLAQRRDEFASHAADKSVTLHYHGKYER